MPTMNGAEVAGALAADGTVAVLLTSVDDAEVEPSTAAGVGVCTPKPVRRDRLRRCLTDALAGARAGSVAAPADAALPERGRVLLAEDNCINQKVALAMLESGGYSVDVVGDGVEAVSAVRARRYDAVLMDCHMPRMDGFEAALAIRAEERGRRRAPIIALTAGAMPEDRERCLAAGMDDHLPKPFKKVDLLAAVARWSDV
jgi:two-component system sensor histidine kinase/response regulator